MSIHWILSGSISTPSSRIHGFNIQNYLKSKGVSALIDYSPKGRVIDIPFKIREIELISRCYKEGEIVIIQKFKGKKTRFFLDLLRMRRVTTIYLDCDFPCKVEEARRSTMVVTSSSYLKDLYAKNGIRNIKKIDDAIEYLSEPDLEYNNVKLQCVWYGLAGNHKWSSVQQLKKIVDEEKCRRKINCDIITISNIPGADFLWNKDSYSQIKKSDVAVIPMFYSNDQTNAKSSIRVVQAMALGLPVLASPIPAYVVVIKDGFNGFICSTQDDWINAFDFLSNMVNLKRMKANAYEFASTEYSLERISDTWMTLFEELGGIEENIINNKAQKLINLLGYKNRILSSIKRLRPNMSYKDV